MQTLCLTAIAYSLACKELEKLSDKPASYWSRELIRNADKELSCENSVAEFDQMLADALNFGEKL